MELHGTNVSMILDTGASVTLISRKTWKEKFPNVKLDKSEVLLKTYSGEHLQVLGQTQMLVDCKQQKMKLPLLIVQGDGPSLFGRNWLKSIKLDWKEIKHVTVQAKLDFLLDKYSVLFQNELGTMSGIEAKLSVKSDAVPKFCRARPVPYALKEAIEKDLERLDAMGVIEKVNYSEWASPVVPVPKPDGSVRLCGDYKVTVNPVIEVEKYPIPKVEDLLTVLNSEDRKYTTISTHKGLYQYKRLPYGISSAPALFQRTMESILQGIPRFIVYIDDVMITGETEEQHLKSLKEIFKQLKARGILLKRNKCSFMQDSVEYLGYRVDAEGLHTSTEKVKAIMEAPQPKNQKQLRSFLGMVNYYGRFVPALSTTAHPLNNLL